MFPCKKPPKPADNSGLCFWSGLCVVAMCFTDLGGVWSAVVIIIPDAAWWKQAAFPVKGTEVPRLLCIYKCFMIYLKRHVWGGVVFGHHRWAVSSLQLLLQWTKVLWWSQQYPGRKSLQPLTGCPASQNTALFSFWCWKPPHFKYPQSVPFQKFRIFYVRISLESRPFFLLPILLLKTIEKLLTIS